MLISGGHIFLYRGQKSRNNRFTTCIEPKGTLTLIFCNEDGMRQESNWFCCLRTFLYQHLMKKVTHVSNTISYRAREACLTSVAHLIFLARSLLGTRPMLLSCMAHAQFTQISGFQETRKHCQRSCPSDCGSNHTFILMVLLFHWQISLLLLLLLSLLVLFLSLLL